VEKMEEKGLGHTPLIFRLKYESLKSFLNLFCQQKKVKIGSERKIGETSTST